MRKLTNYWKNMTKMERRRHIDAEEVKVRNNVPSIWFSPIERKRHTIKAKKNLGVDKL